MGRGAFLQGRYDEEDFHANHNRCDACRGAMIALPALAQQQTTPNPQMQEEADKGAKTRQSGELGYVGASRRSRALPPTLLGGLTLNLLRMSGHL